MVRVAEFRRDERGSMTWTGLSFAVLAILAGGVAVDVMRHEGTRSAVQRTLDACTTSVVVSERVGMADPATRDADLRTALTRCLTRAGLGAQVTGVTATSTAGLASASTTASGVQTNQFMQMLNVNTMNYATAASAGLPASGAVEVVLAYEATNAFSSAGLVAPFRTAAKSFVDILTATDNVNTTGTRTRTSIALLPYANGVNLPAAMRANYTLTQAPNVTGANCIDAPATDFTTAALLPGTSYNPLITADLVSSTTTTTTLDSTTGLMTIQYQSPTGAQGIRQTASGQCPDYANQIVTLPTNNAATLKTAIDAAQFFSAPRWDLGMNWANALLHPQTNPTIASLVPAALNNRPLAYGTANAQKVIVFVNRSATGTSVADNSYTTLKPAYTSGLSPIWRNATVTPPQYCINLPARAATAKFFLPHVMDTTAWVTACPANFVQQTWPQVWSQVRMSWVSFQLYARGMQTSGPYPATGTLAQSTYRTQLTNTFNAQQAEFVQAITYDTQRSQFEQECTAAKAAGVVVYTVAVDAIANAKAPLQACASSANHYFDTTSANLTGVMNKIAQSIRQQEYSQ